MPSNTSQPGASSGAKTMLNLPPPNVVLPQFTSTVEQNVMPVVTEAQRMITSTVEQNVMPAMTEAQRIAAQTSYSGRKAVSRDHLPGILSLAPFWCGPALVNCTLYRLFSR